MQQSIFYFTLNYVEEQKNGVTCPDHRTESAKTRGKPRDLILESVLLTTRLLCLHKVLDHFYHIILTHSQ